MARFLWICLGGAVGTAARYLLMTWIARRTGSSFPLGTLAVNLLGSFLLSAILEVALSTDLIGPTLRPALSTGVLGGFTTYSTFNYDTLRLLEQKAWLLGLTNLAATVVGCLAAGILGLLVARSLTGG
ncbi:MAG: fluoride efflux transporter CrcB [Acidobacteriota bacterium]|nr:fluoride efflux transporter CrcB [Acidobacteriota bacterium]